jgi:hypothetical protein
MFIKKKVFSIFEPSRAHLRSKFIKNAKKSKKKTFLQKFNMRIKNAEFHLLKKFLKNGPENVICKNVTEICTFSAFTHVRSVHF